MDVQNNSLTQAKTISYEILGLHPLCSLLIKGRLPSPL